MLGFSLGGGVALRTAIQHPALVRRLVLVSAPFRRSAWHAEHLAAFAQMGPEMAEPFKQTPLYAVYREIAPRVEDWPVLVTQLTGLLKLDYDWTDEARRLPMPVLIVAGDADGIPPRYAAECFELLGGGQRDAVWDRSGMTRHGLAILPRTTHYDINVDPALATSVATFLDEGQGPRDCGRMGLARVSPGQPGSSSLLESFSQPRCLRSQPTEARWYVASSSYVGRASTSERVRSTRTASGPMLATSSTETITSRWPPASATRRPWKMSSASSPSTSWPRPTGSLSREMTGVP